MPFCREIVTDGCFYFISLSGQVLKCIAQIARSPLQLVPMKQLLWLLYAFLCSYLCVSYETQLEE